MRAKAILFICLCISIIACKNSNTADSAASTPTRAIYHWKTTFDLTQEDSLFLSRHQINRLYVRLFDVVLDNDYSDPVDEVYPAGTTVFKSKPIQGVEIIPTVYITQGALREYMDKEEELSELIVTRVLAMCSWNELGKISEMQYDCDWTESTRESFARLCCSTKNILKDKGQDITLSGTIRLHQLEEATYPFDRGVLMMYNTGPVMNYYTLNSIINYDDANKYLSVDSRIKKFISARKNNCPIIDVAYPTFGWGVLFDNNGKFKRLVRDVENYRRVADESIRIEESDIDVILKVKELVDNTIGDICRGNIIYHLDMSNLNKYKQHEIENILD